jgi:hypothetical protein
MYIYSVNLAFRSQETALYAIFSVFLFIASIIVAVGASRMRLIGLEDWANSYSASAVSVENS